MKLDTIKRDLNPAVLNESLSGNPRIFLRRYDLHDWDV